MATTLCAVWREEWRGGREGEGEGEVVRSLTIHTELVLKLCAFGTVHKKNLRLVEREGGKEGRREGGKEGRRREGARWRDGDGDGDRDTERETETEAKRETETE